MAKPPSTPAPRGPQIGPSSEVGDAFANFLDGLARLLFWAGAFFTIISIGFLIFTFSSAGGAASFEQAKANSEIFGKILTGGLVGLFVGSTYMFWGEEVLTVLQVIVAALLFFGPPFLPGMLAGGATNDGSEAALVALRNGGGVFGVCAILALIADVGIRVRQRVLMGTKSDLLKYGKGVKEEKDVHNVFMGNCYQLPFCRKFVRERCPIYHSRRTCWKEQVGCMCEEEVIRGAMEGRVIPKDQVAATKFIPQNNKLTRDQKFERCKQCVIYNEHQKHKYKLAMPVMSLVFVGSYLALRPFLLQGSNEFIKMLDRMMGQVTFGTSGNQGEKITQNPIPIQEIVLICLLIVAFTYAIKVLEYVIFKLKY